MTIFFQAEFKNHHLPFRWRGRYNEDTILSLDMLKAGWCTILFNAILQDKVTTQTMKGGNEELYEKGTLEKSKMMETTHGDVCKLSFKYKRWHHHCNYKPFMEKNKLVRILSKITQFLFWIIYLLEMFLI